jgi:hypothetical protein
MSLFELLDKQRFIVTQERASLLSLFVQYLENNANFSSNLVVSGWVLSIKGKLGTTDPACGI